MLIYIIETKRTLKSKLNKKCESTVVGSIDINVKLCAIKKISDLNCLNHNHHSYFLRMVQEWVLSKILFVLFIYLFANPAILGHDYSKHWESEWRLDNHPSSFRWDELCGNAFRIFSVGFMTWVGIHLDKRTVLERLCLNAAHYFR